MIISKIYKVYRKKFVAKNYMIFTLIKTILALLLTGLVSLICCNTIFGFVENHLFVVLFLFFCFFIFAQHSITRNLAIDKKNLFYINSIFIIQTILQGIVLSPIFMLVAGALYINAFFITFVLFFSSFIAVEMFLKENFTNFSKKLFFCLFICMLLYISNLMFFKNIGVSFFIALIFLIIYTIFLIIDMQRAKNLFEDIELQNDYKSKVSTYFALIIYINVIGMFLQLITILFISDID